MPPASSCPYWRRLGGPGISKKEVPVGGNNSRWGQGVLGPFKMKTITPAPPPADR